MCMLDQPRSIKSKSCSSNTPTRKVFACVKVLPFERKIFLQYYSALTLSVASFGLHSTSQNPYPILNEAHHHKISLTTTWHIFLTIMEGKSNISCSLYHHHQRPKWSRTINAVLRLLSDCIPTEVKMSLTIICYHSVDVTCTHTH